MVHDPERRRRATHVHQSAVRALDDGVDEADGHGDHGAAGQDPAAVWQQRGHNVTIVTGRRHTFPCSGRTCTILKQTMIEIVIAIKHASFPLVADDISARQIHRLMYHAFSSLTRIHLILQNLSSFQNV